MRQAPGTQTCFTSGLTQYTLVTPDDAAFHGQAVDPDHARWLMARFLGDFLAMRALRAFLRDQLGGDTQSMDDQRVLHVLAQHLARGGFQLVSTSIAPSHTYKPVKEPPPTRPAKRQDPTTWVEIVLLDEAGAPLSGVRYDVARGTPVASGTLDGSGFVRVNDLEPDRYSVIFPELDELDEKKPPQDEEGVIHVTRDQARAGIPITLAKKNVFRLTVEKSYQFSV